MLCFLSFLALRLECRSGLEEDEEEDDESRLLELFLAAFLHLFAVCRSSIISDAENSLLFPKCDLA